MLNGARLHKTEKYEIEKCETEKLKRGIARYKKKGIRYWEKGYGKA
jgi:hypothetical protein